MYTRNYYFRNKNTMKKKRNSNKKLRSTSISHSIIHLHSKTKKFKEKYIKLLKRKMHQRDSSLRMLTSKDYFQ